LYCTTFLCRKWKVSRYFAIAALPIALLTGLVAAGRGPAIAPPESRPGREVVLYWFGAAREARYQEPGSYEPAFPCSHAPGRQARPKLEVSVDEGAARGDQYRAVDPGQVPAVAAGQGGRIALSDRLRKKLPWRGPDTVRTARGAAVEVGSAFVTEGRVLCLVPPEFPDLGLLQATVPGDRLVVRGRTAMLGATPCVLVEDLGLDGQDPTPPWNVVLRWQGEEVLSVSEPGEHSRALQCAHVRGEEERVGLRLRKFEAVDLQIGGQTVAAELAATPSTRGYGLQGRGVLPEDSAMLFFFDRPFRPAFLMKRVQFPLSIAFIRADGVVVSIEQLAPGSTRRVRPPVAVPYVLEMNRGWFAAHGVGVGSRVEIP
jgi:hypothetical protein